MRTVQIEVLREPGWETIVFEDIETLRVVGAPGEDGIEFTLIGQRSDAPNQIEPGVLDVTDRHERLVDSELPKHDGVSLPLAVRDADHSL